MRKIKSVYAAWVLVASGSLLGAPAVGHADTLYFTSDHCTGTCGTGPFAVANVTDLGGGTLHFSIDLLSATKIVDTGFPISVGFNLAGGPTITYSNITDSNITADFVIPDVGDGLA